MRRPPLKLALFCITCLSLVYYFLLLEKDSSNKEENLLLNPSFQHGMTFWKQFHWISSYLEDKSGKRIDPNNEVFSKKKKSSTNLA